MKNAPRIFCLMGPTASGKTDLALKLAHYYPIDIVSVDSALVYKGMDIGSGKPSAIELKKNTSSFNRYMRARGPL